MNGDDVCNLKRCWIVHVFGYECDGIQLQLIQVEREQSISYHLLLSVHVSHTKHLARSLPPCVI